MKIDLTKITYGFFTACAIAGITYLGVTKYYEREISFGENYGEVIQAVDDVENTYYKDADTSKFSKNMIGGLINGLNDKYSGCIDANMETENGVNYSNQLQTAGFKITYDSDTRDALIKEVKHGSPAEDMGLCVGDHIVGIDGVSVKDAGYYNIIDSLIGKGGTKVELTVDHEGAQKNITYVREKDFENDSNFEPHFCEDGIYYFRFDNFDSAVTETFKYTFDPVVSENNVKGLILDLRRNSGGRIDEAVKFFDLFSKAGSQVVTIEEKSGKTERFSTSNDITYKDIKIAVLVSEKTLSSGEIIAALIQDTKLGTVIGTQTGGKGVFQKGVTYQGFNSYNLVAGYYYVNDIPNYDGVGITPDMIVEMDDDLMGTDDDIQLKKAIEILS